MNPVLILVCLPVAFAQVPVYLRTPTAPISLMAAAPIAQLQCSQQCMPSCLPSCLIAQSPVATIDQSYMRYMALIGAYPYQVMPSAAAAPQPISASAPVVSSYQPTVSVAYIPVTPSCVSQCMPTCAPSCVQNTDSSPTPLRDDLPTPPPETAPTPTPELPTTTVPIDIVPCICSIKITITQGDKLLSQCSPSSCTCPKGYNQCGSNCCRTK